MRRESCASGGGSLGSTGGADGTAGWMGGGRLGRWQFFLRRRGNRWFRCRCFFGLRLGGLRRRCGHTAGLQFRYLFFEDVNPRKQRCPRRLQFHVEMRSERTATFSSVLGIAQAHEQRNT